MDTETIHVMSGLFGSMDKKLFTATIEEMDDKSRLIIDGAVITTRSELKDLISFLNIRGLELFKEG